MATATKESKSPKQKTSGMSTAMDLFVHELSDIRSAEEIIISMLERGIKAVSSEELKTGLEEHLEETRGHLDTVDKAFKELNLEPEDVECEGAKGLKRELEEAIKEKPEPLVLDAMIAGGAAKTEHYEISGYSGLVDQAKLLGEDSVAKLLSQNLKEEEAALKKVEKVESKLQKELAGESKK